MSSIYLCSKMKTTFPGLSRYYFLVGLWWCPLRRLLLCDEHFQNCLAFYKVNANFHEWEKPQSAISSMVKFLLQGSLNSCWEKYTKPKKIQFSMHVFISSAPCLKHVLRSARFPACELPQYRRTLLSIGLWGRQTFWKNRSYSTSLLVWA